MRGVPKGLLELTSCVEVVAVCPIVEPEFLFSVRSLADRLRKQRLLREVFAWIPMADRPYDPAGQVQRELTEHALRRSAGAVDLLIAATALVERTSIRWPRPVDHHT